MKRNLGRKLVFAPLPVLLLATYDENGVPNAMNAAWGVQSDYHQVIVFLGPHKTTENLKRRKAFTVSFADAAHVVEADYFGIESGARARKIEKAYLSASKAPNVDAPILDAFPLTLECTVADLREEDGGYTLVGDVVDVLADESILTDGVVDLAKARLLVFDSARAAYRVIGAEIVGHAFSDGKKLMGA